MLLGDSQRQRSVSAHFLSDPHSMYILLAQSVLKSPDGPHDVSININRYPKVKELVDALSVRYSNGINN